MSRPEFVDGRTDRDSLWRRQPLPTGTSEEHPPDEVHHTVGPEVGPVGVGWVGGASLR